MREITFRGLKADGSNEWVYGNLNQLHDGTFILEKDSYGVISEPDYHSSGMGCGLEDRNITNRYDAMQHGWECAIERQFELLPCFIEVIPETVGQFTGLTDKNGTRIFESDKTNMGIVIFQNGSFGIKNGNRVFIPFDLIDLTLVELIN